MEKTSYFCNRFQKEITKRYARSADRNLGNSIVMQNLYNGLRCSAWAFYIFSLQGNPTTSIQEECTAPRFFYV